MTPSIDEEEKRRALVAVGTATYVYVQRGIAEWVNNWGRSERGGEPEQRNATQYGRPCVEMEACQGRNRTMHRERTTIRKGSKKRRDPFPFGGLKRGRTRKSRHHPKAGVQSTMHQPFAPLRVVSIKVNIPIDLYLESKLKTQLVKLLVLH